MKRNIYLVGFMGTGKSTIGRELAKQLGYQFMDMDILIEENLGLSISEIFEKYGEDYFRKEEEKVAEAIIGLTHKVVATGGGTILNDHIREIFLKSGIIICLYTEKKHLIKRLVKLERRPVLKSLGKSLEERVEELIIEREEVYNKITLRLNTTDLTPIQAAKRVVDLLRTRQRILDKLNSQYIQL